MNIDIWSTSCYNMCMGRYTYMQSPEARIAMIEAGLSREQIKATEKRLASFKTSHLRKEERRVVNSYLRSNPTTASKLKVQVNRLRVFER